MLQHVSWPYHVAENLSGYPLRKGGLLFLHVAGSRGDVESVVGTRDMIDGHPHFTHLEEVAGGVYRKVRNQDHIVRIPQSLSGAL